VSYKKWAVRARIWHQRSATTTRADRGFVSEGGYAAEGASCVAKRVIGLKQRTGDWNHHLRFIPNAPNVGDEKDVDALLACLVQVNSKMADAGVVLGLVVLDTRRMARSAPRRRCI
jgi:hypothetical protein